MIQLRVVLVCGMDKVHLVKRSEKNMVSQGFVKMEVKIREVHGFNAHAATR